METLEWHIFYGGIFLLNDSSKPVMVCFIHSLKIYPVSIKKKTTLIIPSVKGYIYRL